MIPSLCRRSTNGECSTTDITGTVPENSKVTGTPLLTSKRPPKLFVLPPVMLTKTLPAGNPHLALKSTLVAERLPSTTPFGKPKSEAKISTRSNWVHPSISTKISSSFSNDTKSFARRKEVKNIATSRKPILFNFTLKFCKTLVVINSIRVSNLGFTNHHGIQYVTCKMFGTTLKRLRKLYLIF